MSLNDTPTAEEVVTYLDITGSDCSCWLGTYGASPNPGKATIRREATRAQYYPTYGYIRFGSDLLCWRVWSQRPAPEFHPERGFKGGDLRKELATFARHSLQNIEVLTGDREWRRA